MINQISFTFIFIFVSACSQKQTRLPNSTEQNMPTTEIIEMVPHPQLGLKFRAGYSLETTDLKGCVLYLQGLADSIRNHKPYFSTLNAAGYRVIFFDYMGQGGSAGHMNDTRVQVELPSNATKQMIQRYHEKDKHYEIPEQADFFWAKYKGVANQRGQNCSQSPKLIIGWSTGGLAAYRMAYEKRADAVIMIAPGIHPKWMVGESADHWEKMILLKQTITERTLTRNNFASGQNPHLDPIKPKSPAHVPQFAGNLIGIASHSTRWKIDPAIAGLVFLSGEEDTYVSRTPTVQILNLKAPHFEVKSYEGALHELDNETPEVTTDLYERSIRFLNSIVQN